ncbi:unnamed protein product [Protopolystoma xenopodis]|uniref:Uncharacterized protein n=1 Tax=Protopolystoma xenopodis TaxID=117903 RepID=A0A3S5AG18_9PLAT|nr:unnamed protein product [Protopolystoma xenopodis]
MKDKVSTADLPSDSANQNANSSTSGQPSSPLAASGNSKANGPNVSLSDLSELDTINQLAVDPLSTQAGRLGSRPLTRPILGAQSLEDARKLLALSESSRRTQRRLPSIIFPTGPSLVPSVNTTFNAMLCYPAATVSTISSTTSSLSIPATNVALASSSITSGYTHHPPSNSSSSYSAVPMPRQLVPQSYVHSIQQPSCHYHQRQQQQQAYSAQQMTRSLPADSRISQALPVLHQPPGHHIQVVHSQSGHLHHMHSHSTQLQHNQQQQLQQTQLNIHKHQANLVRHQQSSQQQQRQHQQHYQYRFQHQNHHHQQQRHSQQSGLVQVPPTPPSLASQEMLSPQAPGLEIPSTGHASLVGIGFEKALLPLAGCSATTILFPPRSSRLLMNGLIPAPARLATRTGTLVVSVADPDSNAGGSSGLTNQSRNFYDRLASGQVITSELHQVNCISHLGS